MTEDEFHEKLAAFFVQNRKETDAWFHDDKQRDRRIQDATITEIKTEDTAFEGKLDSFFAQNREETDKWFEAEQGRDDRIQDVVLQSLKPKESTQSMSDTVPSVMDRIREAIRRPMFQFSVGAAAVFALMVAILNPGTGGTGGMAKPVFQTEHLQFAQAQTTRSGDVPPDTNVVVDMELRGDEIRLVLLSAIYVEGKITNTAAGLWSFTTTGTNKAGQNAIVYGTVSSDLLPNQITTNTLPTLTNALLTTLISIDTNQPVEFEFSLIAPPAD